jgi:hypothetical protein
MLTVRRPPLPFCVFSDLDDTPRCVNAALVQTFVPDPANETATLITFINGDSVTVSASFETVLDTFMGDTVDG